MRGGRRASITPRGSAAATRRRSPRWRLASARRDRGSVQRAENEFAAIGARFFLAQAQDLLRDGAAAMTSCDLPDLLRRRPVCIAPFPRSR